MTRLAGVLLLAMGMLVAPSAAQVSAAERCHTAVCPGEAKDVPACCKHADDAGLAGDDGRAGGSDHSECHTKYCPGCAARPLILTSHRLTLKLEPAPVAEPTAHANASISFDVPFAIFHPPRA